MVSAKIYIVDQDTANLTLTKQLLEAHSYDVKCFTSVEAFVAQHHPTQVGCVLVDLMLPDLGCTFLIGHLLESKSILSVVVLTTLLDPEAAPDFAGSSFGLVKKPYEVQALLNAVGKGAAASVRRRTERRGGR